MNEKECQAYEIDYKKVVEEIQEELYKKIPRLQEIEDELAEKFKNVGGFGF